MKTITKTLILFIAIASVLALPGFVNTARTATVYDEFVYLPLVLKNYPIKVYPLAYVGWESLGDSGDVFVENDDGTDPLNITQHPSKIYSLEWSPDGTKIAFVSDRDGNREIYTINADGSGLLRLTNNTAFDHEPSWSPDGSKIVFVSSRSGVSFVYTMNADGSSVTQLSSLTACQIPLWAPNGSKIGLSCGISNAKEVYLINPDGSGQVNVTNNVYYDRLVAWSPDSTKLMVVSNRGVGGAEDIDDTYILNVNGTTYLTLTTDGNGEEGSWSPDGRKILYSDSAIGSTGTWIVNADGTGKTEVTCQSNSFFSTDMSWSPDSTRIAYIPWTNPFTVSVAFVDGSACETVNDLDSVYVKYYPVK